jgi:RsiW-degrading membrane proteinase PrsW (M82 family)
MFFFFPIFNSVILLYLFAAIIPAIFLLRYIYKMDRIDKESPQLLISLLLRGVAAALVSMALEALGEGVLNALIPDQNTLTYTAALAFLVVAVIEEGTKYAFCAAKTWNSPEFNCRFDGIVYMAFTSLGFAAFENILYVFNYGLSVAGPRAILSVPGHLGFSVAAGALYGRAKQCRDLGRNGRKVLCLVLAYVLAVLLHGFYDFCAMSSSTKAGIAFIIFVIVMYIVIILLIREESRNDEYI